MFLRESRIGKLYDAVVIFPPLPENINVDDGFRTQDLAYREVQTHVIEQLAKAHVDRVFDLRGIYDMDARINVVASLIEELLIESID